MIPIVLKVYDGGKLKSARAFRAERIRLGNAAADLVLESASVAPTHAVIESGALGAVLRATTSAPVYLNGQPILAAPLRHGDLISIGEIRIMVESEKISDEEAIWLSKDIARRIENELEYPGQIKVTVIRESRAIEFAK